MGSSRLIVAVIWIERQNVSKSLNSKILVHRVTKVILYNNISSQLDTTIIILVIISTSSTCFGWCCLLAASSVLYTTSCKHSLAPLRMGEIIARNMLSWSYLWIKLLLLYLVGCLYYYINDTRSHKLKLKTKLRGFSPRANHTDRAAAAGRRS